MIISKNDLVECGEDETGNKIFRRMLNAISD